MKKLENLKNREINNLSKIKGGDSYQMTERKQGDCTITDVINYDDFGNITGRKDEVTKTCPQLSNSIY